MQRIFWAFTEGARGVRDAQGLGRRPGRRAPSVRAVSVVCGLPFTIMLMYMAHALYIAVLEEAGDLDENRPMTSCTSTRAVPGPGEGGRGGRMGEDVVLMATVAPFISIWKVLTQVEGSTAARTICPRRR